MNIFVANKLKTLSKPFFLTVTGHSMEPTIRDGAQILVMPYCNNIPMVGDIIVYRKFTTHLTVHRVVELNTLSAYRFFCKTKGDNNSLADEYVVFNHEIIGFYQKQKVENDDA